MSNDEIRFTKQMVKSTFPPHQTSTTTCAWPNRASGTDTGRKSTTAAKWSIAAWIPSWPCAVKEIAGEFEVREGEVARFLLEYALRAYNEGDLDLIPYPNPNRMRFTLFPVDEPPQRANLSYKPRKTKRKKSIGASWKVITTWRNFSPELKEEISDLASEAGLDVPVGELVTALLRFSLTAYELGLLVFNPVQMVTGQQLEIRGKS